jgi:hypothetical protein
MQKNNAVWQWSETFVRTASAARLNLPTQGDQLDECLLQIESARKQYRRGNAAPLRILYDYWQDVAGDNIREQVRFASGTRPQNEAALCEPLE